MKKLERLLTTALAQMDKRQRARCPGAFKCPLCGRWGNPMKAVPIGVRGPLAHEWCWRKAREEARA